MMLQILQMLMASTAPEKYNLIFTHVYSVYTCKHNNED